MKAIIVHEFGGPEVLKLEDVPEPVPQEGQILIQVEAIGVNPVETYIREGKFGYGPELPFIPGSDAAGTVEAVGSGVDNLVVGDRVYTTVGSKAAYAEKMVVNQTSAFLLPKKTSFQHGASIGVPCGAAWRALFYRGRVVSGETVLVHGATGMAGLAAVQLARAAGLTVIGTSSTEEGEQAILDQGAHFALRHDDYSKIKEITSGKGVDIIVEMRADQNLAKDLTVLTRHGRVVVVGSKGSVEFEPRLTMGTELDIRGMTIMNMPPDEHHAMYTALSAALESGVLRPIVSLEFPLEEAYKAHNAVTQGGSIGKVVLIP